jgi:hypothetical protein
MFVFDDVFDESEITRYHTIIRNHYKEMVSLGHDFRHWYPTRNFSIKEDPFIFKIKDFIESKVRVKLTANDAELQTWHIGSISHPHIHADGGREQGDYNTLLYLNDDFVGGEFYTKTGITIKPIKNRLTFFNGKETYHGINRVHGNHRYTLIVWWKNSEFY